MTLAVNARWIAVALGLLVGLLCRDAAAQASNPNVLWQIVHDKCVPDEQQHGDPKPCAEVDLARRIRRAQGHQRRDAVFTHSNDGMGGIEDPSLLTPLARNYFAEAWQARSFVEKALCMRCPAIR